MVIIGGGFSGAMLAVHLLKQKQVPLQVTIVEPRADLGVGLAYSTDCPEHLLNVPAAGMSAFADQPTHFLDYARSLNSEVRAEDFLSRQFYGQYVKSIIRGSLDQMKSGFHSFEHVMQSVEDVLPDTAGYWITLSSGTAVKADAVILALGNIAGRAPAWLTDLDNRDHRYIHDPWAPGAMRAIRPQDKILLVGTGLTAVDKIIEIASGGHQGTITCLSRHGLLPQRHLATPDLKPVQQELDSADVLQTLHLLRGAARLQGGWRAAVDGCRAFSQTWWQRLDLTQKRRFIRHLQTYWDVHRHRMAPSAAARLESMGLEGRLEVLSARIVGMTPLANQVSVAFRRRGSSEYEQHCFDKVVNCTGPQLSLKSLDNALMTKLADRGLISSHEIGYGIKVDGFGRAVGSDYLASSRASNIFVLGPLLKAELFESVAVPEIKYQVRDLAHALCTTIKAQNLISDKVTCSALVE